MRSGLSAACIAALTALVVLDVAADEPSGRCAARANGHDTLAITWQAAEANTDALDQWCRAVGSPIAISAPVHNEAGPPLLSELVVVTWNAHLGEGRLDKLVDALRAGRLTGGVPVRHFVLLLQELYRRGADVPPMDATMRTAYTIKIRTPLDYDASTYARGLGLSFVYVPSMRNGTNVREDRGNAILSSERLGDVLAIELPLERQRRVAIAASVEVMTPRGRQRLAVVDAHLDPLSSPRKLWVFHNPRPRQIRALLRQLDAPSFAARPDLVGTVPGGDFNTIQGGASEEAYAAARAWARDLQHEDARSTHLMGRIDYLFFRGTDGWKMSTTRADERFGSDHYPVVGRFTAH